MYYNYGYHGYPGYPGYSGYPGHYYHHGYYPSMNREGYYNHHHWNWNNPDDNGNDNDYDEYQNNNGPENYRNYDYNYHNNMYDQEESKNENENPWSEFYNQYNNYINNQYTPKEKDEEEKNDNNNKENEKEKKKTNDELILDYENSIRKEIEETTPLISEDLNITTLIDEYKSNEEYIKNIENISKKYKSIRKVRRDGNCFYRAFIFRLFEHICIKNDKTLFEKIKQKIIDEKELTGKMDTIG